MNEVTKYLRYIWYICIDNTILHFELILAAAGLRWALVSRRHAS